MSRAYIVKYSGGTYDDYYEHNVFVSVNKSKATKYVTKFNNILKKWKDYYAQFEYKKGHSIAWIKDEHIEKHFQRWIKLREINECSWDEIELKD